MPSSILNSDDGVISGTSGLKSSGGDDGVLNIQNNGTTAVTVNASGNVGIGTTSPISKLEVYAATGVGASHATIGAVATGYWNFNSGGNPTTRVILRGYDSSAVEAIRLDPTSSSFINGGNLLVGTTSALAGFSGAKAAFVGQSGFIAQTNSGDSTFECGAFWHPATSGNNTFAIFGTEATYTGRGSITYNRAGGLVAYNTTSDYRAKDISGPITDSGALIDSVPVYMGKMKGATQERPMFIAHETPSYAHTGEKDAVDADGKPVYQQMDASALIPVMWAELQLLRTRMAASEDIITFLTARVEALEGAQA
jgi:hypothetical protein